MSLKVIGKTTTKGETSVDIDLFQGQKLPIRIKRAVNEAVGEYLVEQTLISIEQEKSPVQGGGSFQKLSPEYAKLKKKEVGDSRPNLENSGEMKDEIDAHASSVITLGIFGERAGAADGHNNLSGKSRLPLRQFLPHEGDRYKSDIMLEVERIKADIIAEESTFKSSQFRGVATSSSLYAKLKEILYLDTRSEINLAVLRNPDLENFLQDEGLFDLLKF